MRRPRCVPRPLRLMIVARCHNDGMLVASELTRRFGNRVAVDGVSLDVRAGEVLGLLGPNGAGKTTTIRMLAGVIAPSSGDVVLDGARVTGRDPALRARVGLLTEQPGLWERLSVELNLLTYARLYGIRDGRRSVAAALDRFGLTGRRTDLAGTLSKGLKQRLALARALLHDPAIVLLDEPTAGLDPESARDVRELVRHLRDSGHAVLLSSHNLDEVERVADRVAVLDTKLLAVDTPGNLRRRLFGRRVRVRVAGDAGRWVSALGHLAPGAAATGDTLTMGVADPDADTPRVVRTLVEAGAEIREVSMDPASLEDVYLAVVQRGAGRPA